MTGGTELPLRSRVDRDAVLARAGTDPRFGALVDVVLRRADRWTANPTLVVPGELPDWWHVAWERLGDVAFAQALHPDDRRASWLRSETTRLGGPDVDDWLGPSFRARGDVAVGSLETAHVGLAVSEVLELCPEVLDEADLGAVREALIDRCLLPCERALERFERGAADFRETSGARGAVLHNWYAVLLDGFAAAAIAVGDEARIGALPERYRRAAGLFDVDSYGESLQYGGYAALHLSNLHELLEAIEPGSLAGSPTAFGGLTAWSAHSLMHLGPRPELGPGRYPTMVNFGDSAVTARPPAEVLAAVARFDAAAAPETAALARWLFDTCYHDPELEPADLSTFGFFSQVGWRALVNLLEAADGRSPAELALPTAQRFTAGTVAARDRWDESQTVLAAQAGHPELAADGHRHDDDGSFVLSHRGELFFTDPGHCSYRLDAYRVAKRATDHSTWSIRGASGPLDRVRTQGAASGRGPGPTAEDGVIRFSVDLADAYPDAVTRAERTWIAVLPHVVLVVDDIEATEPVTVTSRFVLNDRDHGLRVNEATDTRLVLRRGGAAAKFFQLAALGDGRPAAAQRRREWIALHDIYQPQPNAPTQGKEGSGVVYGYESVEPATRHRAIYSIVLDAEAEIVHWHVSLDDRGRVEVSRPDGTVILVDPAAAASRR